MKTSLPSRTSARLAGALARFLAEPISRPAATGDMLALSALLRPGDVLLTEGNTRAAALVRRVTRSPWAHVAIYVGPLEAGDDPRCIVEANISAGVRAVPLSEFKGQQARIFRPLGLNETDRQRLADWLVGHIGAPYDFAHAWALGRRFLKLPRTAHDGARREALHLLEPARAGVPRRRPPDRDEPDALRRAARFRERCGFRSCEGATGLTCAAYADGSTTLAEVWNERSVAGNRFLWAAIVR